MTTSLSYMFWLRFNVSKGNSLNSDATELELEAPPDCTSLFLAPVNENEAIRDAKRLRVEGRGFDSAEAAREAAELVQGHLIAAFARLRIAAEFADRPDRGRMSTQLLKMVSDKTGQPAVNDGVGIFVAPEGKMPTLMSFSASAAITLGKKVTDLPVLMAEAEHHGIAPTAGQRLAYDLYVSSHRQVSAESRFLMLMMALEQLIGQKKRPNALQQIIDDVEAALEEDLGLCETELASFRGSLRHLRQESISRAGQRLAKAVEDKEYDGRDPVTFFKDCYEIRSALVHGGTPHPDHRTVGGHAASLEGMVADVIAAVIFGDSPPGERRD